MRKNRLLRLLAAQEGAHAGGIQALIHRLNRIEGQIRGIRGMVENDAYCPDILVQSAAAGAALNAFNKELLASHIRTCVSRTSATARTR